MAREEFITDNGTVFQIGWTDVAQRLSTALDANAITTNAQWLAYLQTRFDATNASGLTAGTRAFFIEFFRNIVKLAT